MTFTKPDAAYWERKFIAYLHDPLDKVFRIPGHGERAAQFLDKYGIQKPNEESWKKADAIAAGFERGQVPSYHSDPNKNGAVDFLKYPVITHPTSKKAPLRIDFPDTGPEKADRIHGALLDFIEKEIGMEPGQGGYSDKFKGDEDRFAVARFLYTHLILRFKLAENDVGGLGAFWHRIPADSRFPDHSIWQHNALCSAIYSSLELSGDVSKIGLMVYSITPVQQFIAKARKLRDYWTGSVLLSWLAFEGMRWVIENLGPDHILYPSLIDQPLINEYMKKDWKVSQGSTLNPPRDIASFPNKFLVLVPINMAESIGEGIKSHILQAWQELCGKVYDTCTSIMGSFLSPNEKEFLKEIFERQTGGFWDLQWAGSYLIEENDRSEIEKLLSEKAYQMQFDLLEQFNRIIEDKGHYEKSGRGVLYSVSHSLVQTALAVSKIKRAVTRPPETGEKCHLCGEFEVLHHKKYSGDISAGEYKENTKEFWHKLKTAWDGEEKYELGHNIKENEKLCSICLTKRMAYRALEGDKHHILYSVFRGKKGFFPSTTEIALTSYFEREQVPIEKRRQEAQRIHDQKDEQTDNQDRYFAILLMDGDNMGKLVNGETLASSWESVMHPEIVARLRQSGFEKKYHDNWKEIFRKYNRRLITPAIHAAISESLGDFSLYGVASIIKEHNGTLIYAGGDDVCAVLPVDTSFPAAQEIQEYYTSAYKNIQGGKAPENISGSWAPATGKLSIALGEGEDISISAAILICHHKESLTQMIQNAHYLLDERAKKVKGKNACAIELRKRAGGSRYFVAKWDEKIWGSFTKIGQAIKGEKKAQVSSSLIYRMEPLRDGIEAILKQSEPKEMLQKVILKQLERSSVGIETQKANFAQMMSDLVLIKNNRGGLEYKPEGLIVASFMAKRNEEEGGRDDGVV